MLSRSFGFWVAAVATTAVVAPAAAYDIGCIYPEDAETDLFEARRNVFWPMLKTEGFETPMVIHRSHESTMCAATCVAYHTPGMLDPISLEPTPFTVPEFGHNGYSMVMCMGQCNAYVAHDTQYFVDRVRNAHKFMIDFPRDRTDIRDAFDACKSSDDDFGMGACADISDIITGEDYHPYTVGHYMGIMLEDEFDNDGWNRNGDMQYSSIDPDPVPCTGNCRLYQDTVGYAPRPDPRTSQPYDESTKYVCDGDCRRWQPLQEGDVLGNLLQQEFVVPHIGTQAKTYLREPTLTLQDPNYDLYEDSLLVIEELRKTSSDPKKKEQIKLFDNKLKVRKQIQDAVLEQFADSTEMSFQGYMMWFAGISQAEHDGVVQAWHEKVAHDLVRPTTVIKYWNDDLLETFGGDPDADGPVTIKARDFEAFVRVMPHGEFPSGSSCLCTAYMEFTDVYLTGEYGRSISNFTDRDRHLYANMEEFRDVCGASRLWGGMHYVASIAAGEEICAGLGTLGSEWVETYRNGSMFPNEWYRGDEGPVCGAGGR
jgi:hypothetical protein